MTEYQSNRPERCGAMSSALIYVEAAAQSAADNYQDYPDLAVKALAEIAEYARRALAADESLKAADAAAFDAHIAAQAAWPPIALVWCENVNAPAHEGQHPIQPNCRHPHLTGEYAEPAPHDEGTSYCTSLMPDCPIHPEPAHECGTPAAGSLDTSDYPARMVVLQRDLNDPESWIFRCGEGHGLTSGMVLAGGWQSFDYASEDDALIGAADHARAMHDMGLPAALAERAAAAERAGVQAAEDAELSRRESSACDR